MRVGEVPGNISHPEMLRYAYTPDCGSRDSKKFQSFDDEEHIRDGVIHPYTEGGALVKSKVTTINSSTKT